MSDVAKQAREAMKAKARRLAGEKDQKVDSSDWSPAEPLNADVKTGMRPISKSREYTAGGSASARRADRPGRKAGGKVMEKDIGIGMANKNMKEANEQRPGVKHVGGMKRGGGLPEAKIHKPTRAPAGHYKRGGKVAKADGGIIDALANALAGRGYIDGSTWMGSGEEAPAKAPGAPMQLVGAKRAASPARRRARLERLSPERGSREMQVAYENEAPGMRGSLAQPVQSDQFMKRGGKKVAKASGGALMGAKPKSRKGGKTDIKINIISAGGKPGPMPMLPPDGGPGVAPVVMPPPAAGGAPGPMMPPAIAAPPPMPAPGPMPMGRKAGGRISKVASSYKDMEVGAGSGEGRLQKTDIAKKHRSAPARRAGGRAPKSYKDMTAGAGSGEGRMQKTEIEKHQRARGA
jgi:hypothetical protein